MMHSGVCCFKDFVLLYKKTGMW